MKKIHFYKANSRLGMINIPYKGTSLNIGVENGPDAVLPKSFLSDFESRISNFEFSRPEDINKNDYFKIMAEESAKFAGTIKETLQNDEVQVVVGGDHSVSFGSTLAVLHKYKHVKVGIIQIDSHADLNLIKTSPTGNFHGMYLRPIFDHFDNSDIEKQAEGCRLKADSLLYIGNLDLDPAEAKFIEENNIVVLDSDLWENNLIAAIMLLKSFTKSFHHIHISFDVDVFDKDLVSATGTPAPNGFKADIVFEILRIIKSSAFSFSLDLVEVNPEKPRPGKTIEIAQKVLETILK